MFFPVALHVARGYKMETVMFESTLEKILVAAIVLVVLVGSLGPVIYNDGKGPFQPAVHYGSGQITK